MKNPVHETYGNQLRVRACGICVQDERMLLINHSDITENDFWSPPGGGISFGEPATDCLIREFKEETGLNIQVGEFLFACEFIKAPLHAIEFFFSVTIKSGTLKTGTDPEMNPGKQIIREAKFLSWWEIQNMKPQSIHGAFSLVDNPAKITGLRGYFKV